MIKRKLLFAAILMVISVTAYAVPAKPGVKKIVNLADGTTVELTLRGDEHFSFYTDAQNKPCLLKDGHLQMLTWQEVDEMCAANRQHRMNMAKADNSRHAARRVGKPSSATTGKHRGLVILIQFSDVKFVSPNPQQVFQRFFNEEGYHDYGMAGSVRDYFLAQSYGKLEIDFDVVGPYTTANELAYYGAHYTDTGGTDQHDTHPVLMVAEAVDAASKDVDYRNYDWDKDGEVDQVFVIYAGYAEAQGAGPETIWPHEWKLAAEEITRKYNGVSIDTYGCASELAGDGIRWGGDLDGIGTACHEFSHCLGLPDMYDTKGNNYAMSYWDVMCSGSYNDNSRTPAGYTSYERWFSGWMEPTELNTMTRINDMAPLAEKPEAYILYNENNRNEFYLLENRQLVGFDKGLYGHGMLILHVDYNEIVWNTNSVNNVADRQRMTIIAADNEYNISMGSLNGDPWPGTSGNTALTNYTTPAATLYNNNVDGRKLMSKSIDNITEDVQNMTVSFVACRPEMDMPVPNEAYVVEDAGGFAVSWPAITGAIGYEVELTVMNKAPNSPEKALLREVSFSKCYSKSTGFTDISSQLSNYGLAGWSGSKLYTSPGMLKIGTSTTTGYVKSPTWRVPQSNDITIVMGADVVKSGQTVKGKLEIKYGNSGESISSALSQTAEYEVTANGKIVMHFNDVRKELFWLTITPSAQMYLNYMAIYDGIWTEEQLGIGRTEVRRKANTGAQTFRTGTNSYTFKNMDPDKRYIYRVRAIGEENTYSQWSEENAFEFPDDVIDAIEIPNSQLSPVNSQLIYDLSGRKVNSQLKKGIYVREGKKVLVY